MSRIVSLSLVLSLIALVDTVVAQQVIEPKSVSAAPASEFGFAATTPLPLLYLEQNSVRSELKLSKEQGQKLDALQKSWSDSSQTIDLERGTPGTEAGTIAIQTRKNLAAILTVAQMQRLEQIILRHREKEHGLPAVLATLSQDLKLTGDQLERFEVLRRKRAETILEHLTSAERANAIRRSIHETNTEFVEAVEKLLTKEQRSRLQEMLGEPFAGIIALREPLTVAASQKSTRSVYLDELADKFGVEPEILKNESVHKELKLSDDQIRKAKEFHVEWRARHHARRQNSDSEVEAVAGIQLFVVNELREILTDAQRVRFDQIAMQYRKNIAGETAALAHPTARGFRNQEQLRLVQQGEPIERILGPETLQMFRAALGEPFKGELQMASPLKISQPTIIVKPNATVPLVSTNRVTIAKFMLENARRYRLDEDQIARLKAIDENLPKLRQLLHRELSQLPPSTDAGAGRTMIPEAKAVEQFRKSVFDQCLEVLDPKQLSVFGAELRLARSGILDY